MELSKSELKHSLEVSRKRQRGAKPVIDALTLEELMSPQDVIKKVNGSAVSLQTPDHSPSVDVHNAIEAMTGFGDFDPVLAASEKGEAKKQDEHRLRMKAVRLQALTDDKITVGETTAFRTLAVYRIVRELARIKGAICPDELLADVDLWRNPAPAPTMQTAKSNKAWSTPSGDPMQKARKQAIMPILDMIINIERAGKTALPYEPPRDGGDMLDYFCFIVEEVALALFICRGSTVLPDYGILGTKGLFNPGTINLVWPSRHELITLEDLMIEETIVQFKSHGETRARKNLHSKYGMMHHEAVEFMHLAFKKTRDLVTSDQEIMRSKELLKLEHIIEQCELVGNTVAQVSALRLHAQLAGTLTESEDDDTAAMIATIRKLKSSREASEIPVSNTFEVDSLTEIE